MVFITDPKDLPEPEDDLGYPGAQLHAIFDSQQMRRFRVWIGEESIDPRAEENKIYLESDVRAFVAGDRVWG